MKKITLLFAVLFCLFSFVYGEGLERAPMSEEYLNSFADYNGGIKPVSRQFVQNYPETKAILPSSYSSVKAGFISPVRDQSPYGCCWAFSACASMEAAYAKRYGTPFMIFSPLNIVNRNPYNVDLDSGGNMIFVEGYLTKYLGPVKEADDPYKSPYKSPAVQPARAGFCENAQTLTDHTFGLTADELHAIKTMVYNQGAAEICFYHSSSYMSNDDISYYCNDNKGSVNHAVTVVGWDDNYSRKKFRTSPSGNGALLIKNSWGPYSHDNGYFWISYEDKTLTQSTAYDFVLPGDVPYTDRITYMSGAADDGVSARYGKVIYHPNEGGTVEAVQAYQYYGGQTIKIEIYVNDVLKGTATGGGDYPGFTTIYMPKSISFKAGDTIEADCDFNAAGSSSFKYPMPVQTEIEGLTPSFPYNTNFYSNNGKNYYDLYDYNFAMGISLLTGDRVIEPESLKLSITEKDIYVNDRGSIIPTLLPEGAESTITWTSSKPDVVLIGKSGANCAYKGLKPGTSIITAVCDKNPKIKATCRINVSNLLPTDIKLNTQTVDVCTKETFQMTGTVIPENATNKTVLWASDDKAIVYINSKGTITGVREGVCYVTATAKGNPSVTKRIKVNVTWCPPRELVMNTTEAYADVKDSIQLSATIFPTYAHNKTVLWSSSDKSVASVNSKGLVYCGKPGDVTITATAKGDPSVTATCKIHIAKITPKSITLNSTSVVLKKGESFTLKGTIFPADANNKTILWSSSDKTLVSVSSQGVVYGGKPGQVIITATAKGNPSVTATCKVTVKE